MKLTGGALGAGHDCGVGAAVTTVTLTRDGVTTGTSTGDAAFDTPDRISDQPPGREDGRGTGSCTRPASISA